MQLKGSCHCGAVSFQVESYAPVPYMRCYCSVCRKTAGGGGYAINLGAWKKTLKLKGRDKLSVYRVTLEGGKKSPARRHFCKVCASALYVFDPRWPDLLHPFASAIDSALPKAPKHCHIMLGSKASWVPVKKAKGDEVFDEYPDLSLKDWHKREGLSKL